MTAATVVIVVRAPRLSAIMASAGCRDTTEPALADGAEPADRSPELIGRDLLDTGDDLDLGEGEREGGQDEEHDGGRQHGCLGEGDQASTAARQADRDGAGRRTGAIVDRPAPARIAARPGAIRSRP